LMVRQPAVARRACSGNAVAGPIHRQTVPA
jgi:hypothetical protein